MKLSSIGKPGSESACAASLKRHERRLTSPRRERVTGMSNMKP
jgi:hypothetical protein